jgi:NAD(P)-dependent dehydrogenase (short-subunit alcohol dehydrogenase family)
MVNFDLTGRTALVTGGSRGLAAASSMRWHRPALTSSS